MTTVVLIIHLLIAVALVGVVLLQRSEGGALGIGGGGGMMTGRGVGNFLTRATAVLAVCFFSTSIVLTILAGGYSKPTSILDSQPGQSAPATPQAPSVPLSR
ncbi:MAG: preprotein translocase subunit SecG [Alphaproteobacteria bacterium]|nr:preprotein translocase subunit SecG [Alphaproteobacteria bacterium]